MKRLAILLPVVLLGCGGDDNDQAVYGKESGLAVNCRAYVQVSIDDYRAKRGTAEQIFEGLERNCGANGISWKSNR